MAKTRHLAPSGPNMGVPAACRLVSRRASRGQALMIAVLVLFAVATLAALFTAIISSQLAQVSRHSDVVQLRNLAEAGLRYANEQLTYGADGADWRPAQALYRTGGGEVTVSVSYGPVPDRLQTRYIRIVSSAVFQDNPFLRYSTLALKSLLLTDYARFITDRYESKQPASLGVPTVELLGVERSALTYPYALHIYGPIRSNTDLIWYGPSRVDLYTQGYDNGALRALGIFRDDRIEVAGEFRAAGPYSGPDGTPILSFFVDDVLRADDLFRPTSAFEAGYVSGFPDQWRNSVAVPNTRRVLSNLLEYPPASPRLYPEWLAPPRIRPPEMDSIHPDLQTNRYLALTRDSGRWVQTGTGFINSGRFGWGWADLGGIYLDNDGDVQYNHDLEKLRLNWVGSVGVHSPDGDSRSVPTSPPLGPADWWDKTGRHYAPPGAEIILHGDDPCPWIEVVRDDLKTAVDAAGTTMTYYWRYPSGSPIPSDQSYTPPAPAVPEAANPNCRTADTANRPRVDGARAVFPFPPNGIIYAEGNVRIRGVMPPARLSEAAGSDPPQLYISGDPITRQFSRRFDLQVVSGGTIYVEGDLLTPGPQGARLPHPVAGLLDTVEKDIAWGSRIALIARDYVSLNTTALQPRPQKLFQRVTVADEDQDYFYNDAQPIYPDPVGLVENQKDWIFRGRSIADPLLEIGFGDPSSPCPPVETEPAGIDLVYNNVRLGLPSLTNEIADIRLIIGHSGWYTPTLGGTPGVPTTSGGIHEPMVEVGLEISSVAYGWEHNSTGTYLFMPVAKLAADESAHWYTASRLEFLPNAYQWMDVRSMLTGADLLRFSAQVYPVRHITGDPPAVTGWDVRPDQLAYVLGPVAVTTSRLGYPLLVQVQALIYAQNGSWFIIPGPWFNDDPTLTGLDELHPAYHEPLNYRIEVYGAISENMPAPLGDVVDWTSKWCGMSDALAESLTYAYDPLLRYPRKRPDPRFPGDPDALVLTPRFPGLPLTPDLVIWGERVSGQAGG